MDKPRYILRHAAGLYWIIKTDQQKEYSKPVITNECGAFIWKKMEDGAGVERLEVYLQECYGIGSEEALTDVRSFLDQLKKNGMNAYLKEKGILK
jgi:hypothetical protein